MEIKKYSEEKNAQILVALQKKHGVRKVIASPGTTNISFVASVQCDPFFEIYSCADERSAAYMACGLAEESGEPVALSCTGATASRNYLPALTEAHYRKLPVLAITSTQPIGRNGHHSPQFIDRSSPPPDTVNLSVQLPVVKDDEDEWECTVKVNRALLELRHRGGAFPDFVALLPRESVFESVNLFFSPREKIPVANREFRVQNRGHVMKSLKKLLLALSIFAAVLPALNADVVYPSQTQPDVAVAKGSTGLANKIVSAQFSSAKGFVVKLSGKKVASAEELFEIVLGNGERVPASKMSCSGIKKVALKGTPDALKLSERLPGQTLTATFTKGDLVVAWSAVLRDGSHYIRQELKISAKKKIRR